MRPALSTQIEVLQRHTYGDKVLAGFVLVFGGKEAHNIGTEVSVTRNGRYAKVLG